ncbi:hypothetical protein ACHAXT_010908 [Thalassiosira profunda]
MEEDPPPPPAPPSPYHGPPSSRRAAKYDERDYEEIFYHFDDYCQDIILSNASKFLLPPEPAEDYEWEEHILDEVSEAEWEGMKKSFCFGMGCGLLGFGMLRFRRARGGFFVGMSRYSSSSSSTRSSGGYSFDPVPPASNALHRQQHLGGGGNPNSRGGLIFDTTLSALLGMGTSLLAIEYGAFYPTTSLEDENGYGYFNEPPQWVSPNIPLVPGRSVVADTLCGPLTEEFRKFPKQLWQSGNHRGIENNYNNHMALYANSGWKGTKYYQENDNAEVVSLGENAHDIEGNQQGPYERLVLDSLQGFVINCHRRSRQEAKLRKIRGMRKHQPVIIPDDGVAADEDLELDDIYLIDQEDERDDGFGKFGL